MADQDQRQAEGGGVCNFFRKPSRNRANIRKRKADDAEEEEEEAPSNLQHSDRPKKTLTAASNKLHFSSSKPSSSKPSEANPDADEETRLFHFESSSEIQVQHDSRATAALEIQVQHDSRATAALETETEFSRDHRAIRERTLKQAEERLKSNPNPNSASSAADKIYKGMNSYTDYTAGFRREQTVAAEKAGGAHGPLRASAHIRTSARFDYQPDICKDYKETGYCGYGDSCKFMHDRGDYKSGWQMEREWDEAEKARKRNLAMGGGDGDDVDGGGGDDDDDDDDDAVPFACFICRQPFEDAVVTKCKHYFCEHCALKHHAKNKKCYVCNKPTLGIFNTAHEIRKKKAQDK